MIKPQTIRKGNRVRSFDDQDFRDVTGPNAYFMEGVVIGFCDHEGCPRYQIKVDRIVKRGMDQPCDGRIVIPPVNGTPRLFGGVCDGVELILEVPECLL